MNEKPARATDFKQRDAESYDGITDAFDRFTERFTRVIAERVVELAAPGTGARVLDVGCGTGVVSLAVARRLSAGGELVGIDLSEGMLRAAMAQATRTPSAAKLSFLRMDAESLDFLDGCFDAVLSMFALRHFPRPAVALAEMYRVLRPGGRVVIAVGSAPSLASRAGLAAAWRRARSLAAAAVGRRDLVACAYLDQLVEKHLPAAHGDEQAGWVYQHGMHASVPRLVSNAGFRDVRADWTGNDGVLESKQDFWDVQVTFSSVARKRLATAPPEVLARLRREFDAGCDRAQATGGRLRYPTGALVVVANKPLSD